MITFVRHPSGLRLYLLRGRVRVHHAHWGFALCAAGVTLIAWDWGDRWWMR